MPKELGGHFSGFSPIRVDGGTKKNGFFRIRLMLVQFFIIVFPE